MPAPDAAVRANPGRGRTVAPCWWLAGCDRAPGRSGIARTFGPVLRRGSALTMWRRSLPPGRRGLPSTGRGVSGAGGQVRPEPGSDTADVGGRRGRTLDSPGELDDLIQRIFTAGVLLGSALAGGTGTVTGVDEAIRRLDDAVRGIPAVGSGLPGTRPGP